MAHVTYRHEAGERVSVVQDGEEAARLSRTDGWSLVDESAEEPAQAQPRPARSSRSSSSSSTSQEG